MDSDKKLWNDCNSMFNKISILIHVKTGKNLLLQIISLNSIFAATYDWLIKFPQSKLFYGTILNEKIILSIILINDNNNENST